jgi:3D (Asp-Asp-Asp) domain-containing protein
MSDCRLESPCHRERSEGSVLRSKCRSLASLGMTATLAVTVVSCHSAPREPHRHEAVVVTSPVRLDGVVVRGANSGWYLTGNTAPYGDPVPVLMTSYCLRGTTRRGRYVRPGIIAADPRFFPLARYVELYIGREYYGRFLIDDTGRKIKGNHIDIWLPTCREAKIFGVKRGTAVLLPSLPQIRQAGAPR